MAHRRVFSAALLSVALGIACSDGPDDAPPTAPKNVLAVPMSSSTIQIAWSPASDDGGVTVYRVYRDGALRAATPATTFTDRELATATRHCYEIGAVDTAGHESARSAPACASTTAPAPLAVWKIGTGVGTITSSPAGIDCGPRCSEFFEASSWVELEAVPDAGSTFTGWEGCISSHGPTCSVHMTAVEEVTATFMWPLLSIVREGTGTGTISWPDGVECGTQCSRSYAGDTAVILTATPGSGSTFAGWQGCTSSDGTSCTVRLGADTVVTARFDGPLLTVRRDGEGTGTVTSSPAGVDCGIDCSESYAAGTTVTLTAIAESGSTFFGWVGCTSKSGTSCTVQMTAAKTVTASFFPAATLLVARDGTGAGTVTSSPAGIDCGTDCSELYASGTDVTLTAAPVPGSTFGGWQGCTPAGEETCTVRLVSPTSVRATFNGPTLRVVRDGTGSGTVISSPPGIACAPDCVESYRSGTEVRLTANEATGSRFIRWQGCAPTTEASCTVRMSEDTTVTATFEGPTLRVVREGIGTGTVTSSPAGIDCGMDCSETYPFGIDVTLSAVGTSGSAFARWSGCPSPSGTTCTIQMNADATVSAVFDGPMLTVIPDGPGTGTITSSPPGIECGTDCTERYLAGATVTLTAVPESPFAFAVWRWCTSSDGPTCTVRMDAARTVTATFVWPTLVVVVSGMGTGTVSSSPGGIDCGADCAEAYLTDTDVELTATAATGSTFTGWEGCASTDGTTCKVHMTAGMLATVRATFDAPAHPFVYPPRVATGGGRSFAILGDRTLWAWGENSTGALGDGTTTDRDAPVLVGNGFVSVAGGGYGHAAAVAADGTVWAWGANDHGQLGDGTLEPKLSPITVASGFAMVSAGGRTTMAIDVDGTLWGWGWNQFGQVGDGTFTDRLFPTAIGSDFAYVANGAQHVLAVKRDGTLFAWGINESCQLGNGFPSSYGEPVPVQIGTGFASAAAAAHHSVGLKTDGTLWAWGRNSRGELGDGTTTSRCSPVLVGGGFTGLASNGGGATFAVKGDGTLWAWGANDQGQIGDGTATDRYTPVLVGAGFVSIAGGKSRGFHTIAMKGDGTVWTWGSDVFGQLGDGPLLCEATSCLWPRKVFELPCLDPRTKCSGVCTDTGQDALNCGACGNACGAGTSCVGGSCVIGSWAAAGGFAWVTSGYVSSARLDAHRFLIIGFNGWEPADAEIYDASTGTFSGTGSMVSVCYPWTATTLATGKVLVSGGQDCAGQPIASAELYDPQTGTWSPTASMTTPRAVHSQVLLSDGRVLAVGGSDPISMRSAEIYDPVSATWTSTLPLQDDYHQGAALRLLDGKVLVAGGLSSHTAQLYDPLAGAWSLTGSLTYANRYPSAVLLPSGKVLLPGGMDAGSHVELYDPVTGTWTEVAAMSSDRWLHTTVVLASGRVLVAGGRSLAEEWLSSAEIYDPALDAWSAAAPLPQARSAASQAWLLQDGRVLVLGGDGPSDTSPQNDALLFIE